MSCGRTYTYTVPFPVRVTRAMARATPEYDAVAAREVIDGWWRAGWLLEDALQVTVHLSSLLTEEVLVDAFNRLVDPPRPLGNTRGWRWVLVQIPPAAMDASVCASRRIQRPAGRHVSTDAIRVRVLHRLVRELYGV